jgi:hypothetical protein
MLWSGMCFKCLGIKSVVIKATYNSIVTHKCYMTGTVSNSEYERISDIMIVIVN